MTASTPLAEAPAPSAAHRTVAIVTIVIGALVVVGALGSSTVQQLMSTATSGPLVTRSLDVSGITRLAVDSNSGALRIRFAGSDDASLRAPRSWEFRIDGSTLRVSAPDHRGIGFAGRTEQSRLVLPASLEGALDADLDAAAGTLAVDGRFDRLALDVSAGTAQLSGAARSLDVDLSVGSARLDLDGVSTAKLTVEAGSLTAALTGDAPDRVAVEVDSGAARITLPDAAYRVTHDVSAGGLNDRLRTDPSSSHSVSVEVSAGSVSLAAR